MIKLLIQYIPQILKALVPIVIALVLLGLSYFGITEDMTVGEAVEKLAWAAVTGFLVWLVPNLKKLGSSGKQ